MLSVIRSSQLKFLNLKLRSISCTTNVQQSQKLLWLWSTREFLKDSLLKIPMVIWSILLQAASLTKGLLKITVQKVSSLTFSLLLLLQLRDVFCLLIFMLQWMNPVWQSRSCSIWPMLFVVFTSIGLVQLKCLLLVNTRIKLQSSLWISVQIRRESKMFKGVRRKLKFWSIKWSKLLNLSTIDFTSYEKLKNEIMF